MARRSDVDARGCVLFALPPFTTSAACAGRILRGHARCVCRKSSIRHARCVCRRSSVRAEIAPRSRRDCTEIAPRNPTETCPTSVVEGDGQLARGAAGHLGALADLCRGAAVEAYLARRAPAVLRRRARVRGTGLLARREGTCARTLQSNLIFTPALLATAAMGSPCFAVVFLPAMVTSTCPFGVDADFWRRALSISWRRSKSRSIAVFCGLPHSMRTLEAACARGTTPPPTSSASADDSRQAAASRISRLGMSSKVEESSAKWIGDRPRGASARRRGRRSPARHPRRAATPPRPSPIPAACSHRCCCSPSHRRSGRRRWESPRT